MLWSLTTSFPDLHGVRGTVVLFSPSDATSSTSCSPSFRLANPSTQTNFPLIVKVSVQTPPLLSWPKRPASSVPLHPFVQSYFCHCTTFIYMFTLSSSTTGHLLKSRDFVSFCFQGLQQTLAHRCVGNMCLIKNKYVNEKKNWNTNTRIFFFQKNNEK